jgi:hypothetical protein
LMPDQRMHELRVDGQRACGHERYKVHDGALRQQWSCTTRADDLTLQDRENRGE